MGCSAIHLASTFLLLLWWETVASSLSSRQMAAFALEALYIVYTYTIGLSMCRYDLQYICTNKDFEWEKTILLEQKYHFKENMSIVST